MVLSRQFDLSSADIVSESFDGDFVVVDLSCGKYFIFSDSADVIWEAIRAGVVPADLLQGTIGFSPVDLKAFVEDLIGNGLISEREPGTPDVAASAYADRLAAATEKPGLTVFDDLADLFMADPIHDADEAAGWPTVRQA